MSVYSNTMERLRRINHGRPMTDKAAVVMLAQEIEAYREQIQRLRGMSTKLLTEDYVDKDIFAKNVKRLLDKKCMSQREFADAVGVTEVAMSRYLNSDRTPQAPILYNMAKVLGVSTDYLFEKHPEEKDCNDCEYGPVWNDICRTCISPAPANADPEEKAAGSGAQAETEAGNILDQLIRKGDALEILNGIISVPRKTPDESILAFQKHLQKYADRIKALPAEGTAEPKVKPCPFCGGTARLKGSSMAWVMCNKCGARTRPHFGPGRAASAVSSWNQRTDPTARAEANEDIIKNLIEEIESLHETIASLRKGSISADRAEEIAEDAARKFKRAALEKIEKLEMPLLGTQDPYMQFKFSGMGEAHAAIRNLPPDPEE